MREQVLVKKNVQIKLY